MTREEIIEAQRRLQEQCNDFCLYNPPIYNPRNQWDRLQKRAREDFVSELAKRYGELSAQLKQLEDAND